MANTRRQRRLLEGPRWDASGERFELGPELEANGGDLGLWVLGEKTLK